MRGTASPSCSSTSARTIGSATRSLTLTRGKNGGPWGILAPTWPTVHAPKFVPYEIEVKGIETRVKAGGSLHVESTAIKNPVTGADAHPGIVLPEGIIFKRGDLGASTICRFTDYAGSA